MIGNSRSKASAMTCCSSRLASWLTQTVRGRRFVLRRGIGASVSGPMRIARPTRHQRRSREAVAIVRAQPIPWDRYRQIKRKFCTIVGGVSTLLIGVPEALREPISLGRYQAQYTAGYVTIWLSPRHLI
jgi:hypothetical protein